MEALGMERLEGKCVNCKNFSEIEKKVMKNNRKIILMKK